MQTLNLTNLEESDIKYNISHFPDGEVQITLEEFSRKEDLIRVKCRITNAEELFILCQVNDILTRHGVPWNLEIYYLMGMRMDRVMDFNRPFTLSVVANIISSFSYEAVAVLEPHSIRTIDLLRSCMTFGDYLPKELIIGTEEFKNSYTLVLPDEGAYLRHCHKLIQFNIPAVRCNKTRDIATGKITGFEIKNPEAVLNSDKPFMVVDDLCDGGGTFCGVASAIKAINPNANISIVVTHMVNSKGIENLSKNFDHVYFTNSYKDWDILKTEYGKVVPALPENVTQIKIV